MSHWPLTVYTCCEEKPPEAGGGKREGKHEEQQGRNARKGEGSRISHAQSGTYDTH